MEATPGNEQLHSNVIQQTKNGITRGNKLIARAEKDKAERDVFVKEQQRKREIARINYQEYKDFLSNYGYNQNSAESPNDWQKRYCLATKRILQGDKDDDGFYTYRWHEPPPSTWDKINEGFLGNVFDVLSFGLDKIGVPINIKDGIGAIYAQDDGDFSKEKLERVSNEFMEGGGPIRRNNSIKNKSNCSCGCPCCGSSKQMGGKQSGRKI